MSFYFNSIAGSPTANSYISVDSADDYFEARGDSEYWLNMSGASTGTVSQASQKQRLLVQATREIDRTFRFHGGKYNTGIRGATDYQALQFPRESNTDNAGAVFIPDEIKDATCEQAIWISQRNPSRRQEGEERRVSTQFSDLSMVMLKPWITRMVLPTGSFPWEGSRY